MKKVVARLLIFFIGLPVVIGLVFFNQLHHIALHVLMVCAAFLASNELYAMLGSKISLQKKALVISASVIPPLMGMFCALFNLHSSFIDYSFICAVMVCLGYEVLCMKTFEKSVSHLLSSTFVIFYCGFFMTFIARMTMHQESRILISVFLLMVFMCDSVAWFFGNLFGNNNTGVKKASPNKSIAGFIGGFAGAILVGVLSWFLFPDVFYGSVAKILVLAFVNALASIIGDLLESVIKRSVEVKDSGSIVPGRGGVLDSIDSVVFAAPLYYFLINFLYLSSVTN